MTDHTRTEKIGGDSILFLVVLRVVTGNRYDRDQNTASKIKRQKYSTKSWNQDKNQKEKTYPKAEAWNTVEIGFSRRFFFCVPKFVDLRLCGVIFVKPTSDSRLGQGEWAFWKFKGDSGLRVVLGHHRRWSRMMEHSGATIGFRVHMNLDGGHDEHRREKKGF